MNCAGCHRDLGDLKRRKAFICVEVAGDEHIYSYWYCPACRVYTAEVYHDRFMGEASVFHQGPLPKAKGDDILASLLKCPDPGNKRCTCNGHREFNPSG